MVKLFSKNSNLRDHNPPTLLTERQTDGGTDGRTDRETTCDHNTALCTKVHRVVKNWTSNATTAARKTRKPSYRWQTRATRKSAKNCSNSTCLKRCRWQYWHIFIRLAVVASEICEIPRNSLKIQTYGVQGHPRSSILVSMESPYVTLY